MAFTMWRCKNPTTGCQLNSQSQYNKCLQKVKTEEMDVNLVPNKRLVANNNDGEFVPPNKHAKNTFNFYSREDTHDNLSSVSASSKYLFNKKCDTPDIENMDSYRNRSHSTFNQVGSADKNLQYSILEDSNTRFHIEQEVKTKRKVIVRPLKRTKTLCSQPIYGLPTITLNDETVLSSPPLAWTEEVGSGFCDIQSRSRYSNLGHNSSSASIAGYNSSTSFPSTLPYSHISYQKINETTYGSPMISNSDTSQCVPDVRSDDIRCDCSDHCYPPCNPYSSSPFTAPIFDQNVNNDGPAQSTVDSYGQHTDSNESRKERKLMSEAMHDVSLNSSNSEAYSSFTGNVFVNVKHV